MHGVAATQALDMRSVVCVAARRCRCHALNSRVASPAASGSPSAAKLLAISCAGFGEHDDEDHPRLLVT